MDEAACLRELTALFENEKVVTEAPAWRLEETPSGARIRLVCSLWIGETLSSGLSLEMYGPQTVRLHRPYFGLTAVLLAMHRSKRWHLGRIEFDPIAPVGPHHRNPTNVRHLEQTIFGPHFHGFVDNAALGLSALSPEKNLPVARPLGTTIVNFADILTIVAEHYRISGLWLEEPGWSQTLV